MSIGEKIAQVHKESGLSDVDFAEKCGITADELKEYENGNSIPDIAVRASVTKAFNLDADALCLSDEEFAAEEDAESNLDFQSELSEQQYETPKTSPKRLFRKCADNTVIIPYVYFFALSAVIQIVLMGIEYLTNFSVIKSAPVAYGILNNLITYVALPLFTYKAITKQFKRAFMYFNKYDEINKYVLFSFVTVYLTSSMLLKVVNYVVISICKTAGFNTSATETEISNSALTLGIASVVSLVITIILLCLFVRWFYSVIYNVDGDYKGAKKNDNLKSVSKAICVLAGANIIVSIIHAVKSTSGSFSVVLNLFISVIIALIAVPWVLFAGAKENRNNNLIIKTAPISILIVSTALDFLSSTINIINK